MTTENQNEPVVKFEDSARQQNQQMRNWFESITGLEDAMLSEHMEVVKNMLNYKFPTDAEIEAMARAEYPLASEEALSWASDSNKAAYYGRMETKAENFVKGAQAVIKKLKLAI